MAKVPGEKGWKELNPEKDGCLPAIAMLFLPTLVFGIMKIVGV